MGEHGREGDNSSSCIPKNLQPLELGPNPGAPIPWLPSSLPRSSLHGFGGMVGFSTSSSLREVEEDFGMSNLGTGPVPGSDSPSPPPTCAGETLPDFGPGPPETSELQNSRKLPSGIPRERTGAPTVGSRAVQEDLEGGFGAELLARAPGVLQDAEFRETGEAPGATCVCRFGACSGPAAGLSHVPR